MGYKEIYNEWLTNAYFDADTKAELERIASDENEIKERFYTDLEFGTAGLRGIIGAGTNRMNIYTVRKATQGLANYILKSGNAEKTKSAAIIRRRETRPKSKAPFPSGPRRAASGGCPGGPRWN